MRLFRDAMCRSHFIRFRALFGKSPVHGALGPSGRFSARVAHLTILMVGDVVHRERPQFYRSLFELRDLFPVSGFARLARRIDRSFCPDVYPCDGPAEIPSGRGIRTIRQAVRTQGPDSALRAAFHRCQQLMDSFTDIHIAAARKYTVDPGLAMVGIRDGETAEAILHQRHRVGDAGLDAGRREGAATLVRRSHRTREGGA
jgi:hypothetical protein